MSAEVAESTAPPSTGQSRLTRRPKNRPEWFWRPAGWLGGALIRCVRATARLRFDGREHLEAACADQGNCVMAFWHRHLLLMVYGTPPGRLAVWTSQSDAGELITRAVGTFGVHAARGSNSRGGLAALQAMARLGRDGYTLTIAPDGPRGPRSEVKPGTLMVAALAGRPVVPVAYAARWAWRAPGWDRMLVPLPGAAVQFVYGEAFSVRRGDDLEALGVELKRRIDAAEARAFALLGRRPKEIACAA